MELGGGLPTPAKEKDEGVSCEAVLLGLFTAGAADPFWELEDSDSPLADLITLEVPNFSLTISCSPSSLTSRSDSSDDLGYPSNRRGLGGYPYLISKLAMPVFSVVCSCKSPIFAVSGKVRTDCPVGPRILIRMVADTSCLGVKPNSTIKGTRKSARITTTNC